MDVYLNGEFVPEEEASVSVFDRGFLYGDGAFETLRIYNGKPFLLERHIGRLGHSLGSLHIPEAYDFGDYVKAANELIRRNEITDGILRIQVTRGTGKRGYSTAGNYHPTLLISLTAAPPIDDSPPAPVKLITATSVLIDHDPFSTFKTTNKLVNIIAMREAETAGADDALLLNQAGQLTETTSSNLFLILNDTLRTPPLASGCLAGITRAFLLEIAAAQSIPIAQENLTPQQLDKAQGLFLTNSIREIQPVDTLDGQPIPQNSLTEKFHQAYRHQVRKHTQ